MKRNNNKSVIDINFCIYKDLSTLKSDIHLDLAAPVNYHFFVHIITDLSTPLVYNI